MLNDANDSRLVDVWAAMADQFLDTEVRTHIPLTALLCVQAGLSPGEARDVWRYNVSPAVAVNGWLVAGEWIGWDRDWLVETILRGRNTRWCLPGPIRWLIYRVGVHFMHGVWVSIERCMEVLLEVESPDDRRQMAMDLSALAGHYLDFCPADVSEMGSDARRRLQSLYPDPFCHVIEPALVAGEAEAGDQRVRDALGREGRQVWSR